MTEEPITDETNMIALFKEMQDEILSLQSDDNSTYLFDMELNPYERTDGACKVFSECNNLMVHDDYQGVKEMVRERYFYHLSTMVPSSVAFKYDGPLANPEYFNGSLGVPWRDENNLPYVIDDLSDFIPAAAKSSPYSLTQNVSEEMVASASQTALEKSAKGFVVATGETVALLDATSASPAAAGGVAEMVQGASWPSLAAFVALNVLVTFGTVMLTQRFRRSTSYSPI